MNIITNDPAKVQVAVAALQYVFDPEIGLNVIDLGLIYQIDFDVAQKKIFCYMTLTTEYCPMGDVITTGVFNALQDSFDGYSAEVSLTFDPPWNQDMISPEGKDFLKKYK